jgi:hypothetical protein
MKPYKRILDIKGEASVSRTLDFDWHKRFREGMTEILDKEGRGRKKKITETLVTSIAATLEKDRRLTVRALSAMFDTSYGTVQSILTKDLKMRKVSTLVYFIFRMKLLKTKLIFNSCQCFYVSILLTFYKPRSKSGLRNICFNNIRILAVGAW